MITQDDKRPLYGVVKKTDELKKLILENPDLPLVVLCDTDVCCGEDYASYFAPGVDFSIGEILDCDQEVNDERIFTDRDEFEEEVFNMLDCSGDYDNSSKEQLEARVKEILAEYEPYWKKCIVICATT